MDGVTLWEQATVCTIHAMTARMFFKHMAAGTAPQWWLVVVVTTQLQNFGAMHIRRINRRAGIVGGNGFHIRLGIHRLLEFWNLVG